MKSRMTTKQQYTNANTMIVRLLELLMYTFTLQQLKHIVYCYRLLRCFIQLIRKFSTHHTNMKYNYDYYIADMYPHLNLKDTLG